MSGIPRPVDDLPAGSLSVRLIKGEMSNNIAGHPVDLSIDGKVQTVKTDEAGRAQFDKLPAGARLKASAVVDGERLESQEFPAPSGNGIRLLLVATDKEKAAAEANTPVETGPLVIAGDSRIVIEPSDESLSIYYLLEVVNHAQVRVNPPEPFVLDLPAGATKGTVIPGSSPQATISGSRLTVAGPFPIGVTTVQVGMEYPFSSSTVELVQRFPAVFEQIAVVVRNETKLKLSSPQFNRQQEATVQGTSVIVGMGEALVENQPLQLTLSGLPFHSRVPRWTALSLASVILLAGVWAGTRPVGAGENANERKRLTARREKLLQELVRLEQDRRRGKGDEARYRARREDLLAALEQVYGTLDDETDDPLARAGAAAPPPASQKRRGDSLRAS